ncbi:type I secretion system LssZ [Legionella rubrilucens]|uniref:Type I secretion system LssZ n=1 Tax=Legionella rubrilucens TaxID=458 RepID=A0A0W0Y6G0_9GAMM|nr:type I secretion system protein LssZ [Legionella rubrilucens]KTD52410.1 type I secretion system LssZ [Legionella rubrilucens]
MYYFSDYLQFIFPFFTLMLLVIGLTTQHRNSLLAALWLSLIATILHYQTARGEILGSYFDYKQAAIYTVNLLVLLISSIYLVAASIRASARKVLRFATSLFFACFVTGALLLLVNIWVNAHFLSDRMPNTPILQVAAFKKMDYCDYRYVFYKVSQEGKISYMCPNHYGLVPSEGSLDAAPQFVIKQLPPQLQIKFKQDTLEGNS